MPDPHDSRVSMRWPRDLKRRAEAEAGKRGLRLTAWLLQLVRRALAMATLEGDE